MENKVLRKRESEPCTPWIILVYARGKQKSQPGLRSRPGWAFPEGSDSACCPQADKASELWSAQHQHDCWLWVNGGSGALEHSDALPEHVDMLLPPVPDLAI